MDIVFEEEKVNLQKTESKLKSEIEKHKALSKKYVDELNDYEPGGLGPSKADLREAYKREDGIVETFETYIDEPYFGRMDLDVDGSTKTEMYYIGKTGISINQVPIVVDWRSKVGEYFYMKSERTFQINGYKYQLALRRALDVKKGVLLAYNTEYDVTDVSLEGDVMDPFLITVLRDKRREHRLTDIIKTIQGKQNEIIRKPREEQFIVQGCAGSGKTMILLHRLSYLKFNNRDLTWKNVKIVTPNKTFEAHINDLSMQLGLDEIERLSVDEYYARLIHLYSDKIAVTADVASEKGLNENLLSLLYSMEYMKKIEDAYEQRWEEVIDGIINSPLPTLISKLSLRRPDFNRHNQATYLEIKSSIRDINLYIEKQQEQEARLLDSIQRANLLINEKAEEVNKARSELERITPSVKIALTRELEKNRDLKDSLAAQAQMVADERERLSSVKKEAKQARDKAQKTYQSLVGKKSEYISYDVFEQKLSSKDEIAMLLLRQFRKEYDEIHSLEEEYHKIPIYRFLARNQTGGVLKEKKNSFVKLIGQSIEDISLSLKGTFEQAESSYSECDSKLKTFEQENKASEEQYGRLCELIETLAIAVARIGSDEIADLSHEMTVTQFSMIEGYVSEYVDYVNNVKDGEKKITTYKTNGAGYADQLAELRAESISQSDKDAIAFVNDAIDKLKLSALLNDIVVGNLRESYKEKGEKYSKENYRHKLYLKLLLCNLYFSSARIYDSFLNIDEAQDISVAEYTLLRRVLGNRCIFNLYGDVNQLVYSYKGISDWNDIASIVGNNVYVLNENYRNTLQITEYCNKVFSSEVYPIGVTGELVEEKNLKDSVEWLKRIKQENADYRCAIIYRHGKEAIVEALKSLMKDMNVSWNIVDDSRISVITVEVAKGLEFETVVAVTDSMSVNERYISFTRALSGLCVVDERFADIVKRDLSEETDEIEEPLVIGEDEITNAQATTGDDNSSKEPFVKASDESGICDFAEEILKGIIDEAFELSDEQKEVLETLNSGIHSACNGQSGSFKSMLFWIMALKARKDTGKQSIITASRLLQENELVLAERMGLIAGCVGESAEEFSKDVKKDKYDVIFIPFEFLQDQGETSALLRILDGKIKYWGIDHPSAYADQWDSIKDYGMSLKTTFFLMSKEGFGAMNLEGYRLMNMNPIEKKISVQSIDCISEADKWSWFDNNLNLLDGVGIIYCNAAETCKAVSKYLKKKKVKAPEYTDIHNIELMHYIINSFISGGVKIIVTTPDLGKYISHHSLNFIIHFDSVDEQTIKIHGDQISSRVLDGIMINMQ